MNTIDLNELQSNPLGWLPQIKAGQAVTIMGQDRAIAEIRPVDALPQQPRPVGLCQGAFAVPAGFDDPLPDDVFADFEGA
jgi:antitoxin (DNA-binding transcriptional repressor) of toxin-antitoxin stability system